MRWTIFLKNRKAKTQNTTAQTTSDESGSAWAGESGCEVTSRSRISWRAGGRHSRELAGAGHGGSHPRRLPGSLPGRTQALPQPQQHLSPGGHAGRQQGRPAQPLWGHPPRLGRRRGELAAPHGLCRAPTNHTVFHYVALTGNALGPSGLLPSFTGLWFAGRAGGHQPPAVQSPLQPRGCSSSGPPAPRPPCSSAALLLGQPRSLASLLLRHPCSSAALLLRHPCCSASLLLGLPVLRFPARSAHRLYGPARGHSSSSTNNLLRLPSSTDTCPIQCPLSGLQKKFSVVLA